jgi:NADPH:quinone reductase-like Zn-dependent oxidoreductase
MQAFQLLAHGKPGSFELRDVPDPKPGPGEVIVEVRACGLNHLDLWAEEGGLPVSIPLPRTLGGEVAGRIAEVGDGVRDWKLGDPVAIQSNLFCGECEYCRRGDQSMCLRPQMLGVECDGGFAEKVGVPQRALVRLPAGVDYNTSAALTLAGSTAMHMLTNRAQVRPGDWALVIGASSGVGSAAIQIAKQLGARVIATASTEPKQALARQLGAEFVVDPNGAQWPAEVRRLTGKRGVDIVIEHVGGDVLLKAFECLARGGTVVTCGATAGRGATLNLWPFFVRQHRLVGSYSRNAADVRATLEWAATGRLQPVIHAVFPLKEAAHAFAALRARTVLGKVLVLPGGAE